MRHGRCLLDTDADQPLEHLDLRSLPEVVAAQRRCASVGRRAGRAGAEPEWVSALARAVVARWWEQAYGWERETVWPRRLHLAAGGNAGGDLERWQVVGRDAVAFPEVVAVVEALLDPAMAELVWADSGAGRPQALPADGLFCRRLGTTGEGIEQFRMVALDMPPEANIQRIRKLLEHGDEKDWWHWEEACVTSAWRASAGTEDELSATLTARVSIRTREGGGTG
ncbi:DUF4265 domain-containing protein [Streptomyces sp. NPDC127190]|uniref:DUF4265 domain-containing protein n=1 Tax=Streptomyces sp. NPDC127190 TaxID=3345387 RepID=UPI0036433DA7